MVKTRAALVLLLVACGPASSGEQVPRCVPGSTQACVLEDGENGSQICDSTGSFGPCRPRPHHSGASAEDVAAMRWLGTHAVIHRDALSRACGPISQCQSYRRNAPPGDSVLPEDARTCLETRLPPCEAAVQATRNAQGPAAVQAFVRGLAEDRAGTVCEMRAHLAVWVAVPDLARQLRYDRREGSWEYLSEWADRHEQLPAVRVYRETMQGCFALAELRDVDVFRHPEIVGKAQAHNNGPKSLIGCELT